MKKKIQNKKSSEKNKTFKNKNKKMEIESKNIFFFLLEKIKRIVKNTENSDETENLFYSHILHHYIENYERNFFSISLTKHLLIWFVAEMKEIDFINIIFERKNKFLENEDFKIIENENLQEDLMLNLNSFQKLLILMKSSKSNKIFKMINQFNSLSFDIISKIYSGKIEIKNNENKKTKKRKKRSNSDSEIINENNFLKKRKTKLF